MCGLFCDVSTDVQLVVDVAGCVFQHVGCDWQIDSRAQEDHCGVCRGDGTSCKTVKSKFNDEQGTGSARLLWMSV